jgi:hypothetical protein
MLFGALHNSAVLGKGRVWVKSQHPERKKKKKKRGKL